MQRQQTGVSTAAAKKDVILPKGTLFISIFPPFQMNKIYCYSFYEMCTDL